MTRLDPLGLDLLDLQAKGHAPDHPVDVAMVRDFAGKTPSASRAA